MLTRPDPISPLLLFQLNFAKIDIDIDFVWINQIQIGLIGIIYEGSLGALNWHLRIGQSVSSSNSQNWLEIFVCYDPWIKCQE